MADERVAGRAARFLLAPGEPAEEAPVCYRVWHLLPDPRCKTAVRVAERFADADGTADALGTAHRAARSIIERHTRTERRKRWNAEERLYAGTLACSSVASDDPDASRWVWTDVANTLLEAGSKWHTELVAICDLVRDAFGNPFRKVSFAPEWPAPDVVALAAGIYAQRDAGAMPVLADALQEAGCTSDDILNHCRHPHGAHARGCWVLDLILEKA